MSPSPPALARYSALALLAIAIHGLPVRAQIGPIVSAEGPINRSMGGASVAAPLDSLGALYWNPATTSALPNSADFGIELAFSHTRLSSGLPANAFGAGLPPIPLAGSSRGDNGPSPLPSLGLLYRPADSPWTFGLGLFEAAGFAVNYPASATNPILTPQPPNGVGLGALYSNLQVLQFAPTVAAQLTDRLAAGLGPTVDLALLQADPLLIAPPNANGMFPAGTHSHLTWGGGVQAGLYYVLDGGWQLGAAVKSPQWFEPFHFNSTDSRGLPRSINHRLELPLIPSVGVGYSGFERWLLAADFRYVDFGNAGGLRESGFDATGALRGVGWRSIFAMALAAQYQLTDGVTLRIGYTFNENPVSDAQSSTNVASPTIIEHTLYLGASYQVWASLVLSLGYAHGFENAIAGPLVTPLGAVPGSSIGSTASADSFQIGATVRY